VQVETCTDMSLPQSSPMAPFKSHNKIVLGTLQPCHVHTSSLKCVEIKYLSSAIKYIGEIGSLSMGTISSMTHQDGIQFLAQALTGIS
jgi:hypothetical protein